MSVGTRLRALRADEVAWSAVLPGAVVAVAAMALLGPPLGRVLFSPGSEALWPQGWWETQGQPRPGTQGAYLLAMLAALLPAAAALAGARRGVVLRPAIARALALASQVGLVALVAVALIEQHAQRTPEQLAPPTFGIGVVTAAIVLVLVAAIVLPRPSVHARLARLAHETPARRAGALVFVVAFTALWLLKGIMTDRLTGDVSSLNLPYTFNDALAVLGGRTPLVDYHLIYAKLLPYATSVVLATFGTTVLVYTIFMAVLNGLTLVAVYAVFRRIARSSLLALGLFAPFLAVSDIDYFPFRAGVLSPLTLSAVFPMRYGGAYLLAWLTARHLDARRPRRVWTLGFVAGLVALNNLEFGSSATVATVAALACAWPPRSAAAWRRLAAQMAAGVAGAVVVVCLITVVRAGALPDPAQLLEWPRIFTRLGWFSLPLRPLGLHVAIYATFAAAIALAAVRVARGDDDRLLTGMLAWSGVLGLLGGGYFVGRPDAQRLDAILSSWGFAVALLTIACVRTLAARGWRRPTIPELLVLFGFALSVCALSHFSPPQHELARLTRALPPPRYEPAAERFVGERTHRGERVAILLPMSYLISHDLRLDNVSPYGFMNAIVTKPQMRTLVDALRREHVADVFVPAPHSFLVQEGDSAPAQLEMLIAEGFRPAGQQNGLMEFSSAGG